MSPTFRARCRLCALRRRSTYSHPHRNTRWRGKKREMKQSRRRFLRDTGCGLTSAALVSSLEQLNIIHAYAQQPNVATDYKALVCIFLFGGTDGNNMIVPL